MCTVRVIAVLLALALAACSTSSVRSPSSQPVSATRSLSGAWTLTVESPMGTDDVLATFTQAGEQLTGTVKSSSGEVPLEGTVQGNAVNFGMSLMVRGQPLVLSYVGVLKDDRLSGTVQFGPIGSGTFSGQRTNGDL